MMEYGVGWGIGWLWMFLFWLIPILFVLAVAKYLFSGRPPSGGASREDKALSVLEERYARGEINREEFMQKRDDLKRT